MFKTFFLSRITQISTYGGLLLIFHALIPGSWLVFLGLLLIFTSDKTLEGIIGAIAPGLKAKIEAWKWGV